MNLAKITIRNVRANEVRHFVSTLEDLPEETIQGCTVFIGAYYNPSHEEIGLNVLCDKEESKKIQFNAPKNSKIVRKSDNELDFDYKGRRYSLKKDIEGTCYP